MAEGRHGDGRRRVVDGHCRWGLTALTGLDPAAYLEDGIAVGRRRLALQVVLDAGQHGIEQVGHALGGGPPRRGTQRRRCEDSLADQPVRESPHDAQQMIVAARPSARTGREERREQIGGDVLDPCHRVDVQEAVEQVQLPLFAAEAPAERPLVREEAGNAVRQHTVKRSLPRPHRMVSPSPRATSRSVSTATFV